MPIPPYHTLSEDERLERVRALARKALAAYGLQDAQLSCLRGGERPLLKVIDASGSRFALRLWPADQATASLDRELHWLTALRRDTGLHIPEPILSTAGEWIGRVAMAGVPGFRSVVLLRWVDGRFFDSQLSLPRMRGVGAFLARLHGHGKVYASAHRQPSLQEGSKPNTPAELPELVAPLEDGSCWKALSNSVRALGERATPQLLAAIARVRTPAGRGMIHGAAHQKHYLFHDVQVGMIGFAACRIGHPLEDLASVCRHLSGREGYTDLREALLEGFSRAGADPTITSVEIEAIAAAQLLGAASAIPMPGTRARQVSALTQHLENTFAAG